MLEERQHIFLSYFTTLSAALLNRPGPTTLYSCTLSFHMLYLISAWISHGILSNITVTSLYKQVSSIMNHGYPCPIFDDHFFYFHNLSVKLSSDNVRRN